MGGGGERRPVTDDGQQLDGGPDPEPGHRGQDRSKRLGLQASLELGGQLGAFVGDVAELSRDTGDDPSERGGAGNDQALRGRRGEDLGGQGSRQARRTPRHQLGDALRAEFGQRGRGWRSGEQVEDRTTGSWRSGGRGGRRSRPARRGPAPRSTPARPKGPRPCSPCCLRSTGRCGRGLSGWHEVRVGVRHVHSRTVLLRSSSPARDGAAGPEAIVSVTTIFDAIRRGARRAVRPQLARLPAPWMRRRGQPPPGRVVRPGDQVVGVAEIGR